MIETALRELREETGLTGTADRLTGVYYEPETDAHHFVFGCTVEATAEAAPASPEISECGYWPASDLPRPISTFTIERITDALADVPRPLPTVVSKREWLD